MNKKLVMLVGPPGSGKTGVSFIYDECVYVNQDTQGVGHLGVFRDAILAGESVIVDRLNFSKEQRNRYLDLAKKHGYRTEILVLHQPYEVCLQRCLNRRNHQTIKDEKSARSALKMFFSKYERVEDGEADLINRWWPDGNKPDAVWCDIDNTLSNADHREHYLQGDKKNWAGFFSEMHKDSINLWCKQLILGMKNVAKILIVSGRPDNYRDVTEAWLKKYDIPYDQLIMRQRNDTRKDSIAKEIMYEFEIKPKFNLLFSVDDRRQVIEQIRKHGVIVLDHAGPKGDF